MHIHLREKFLFFPQQTTNKGKSNIRDSSTINPNRDEDWVVLKMFPNTRLIITHMTRWYVQNFALLETFALSNLENDGVSIVCQGLVDSR